MTDEQLAASPSSPALGPKVAISFLTFLVMLLLAGFSLFVGKEMMSGSRQEILAALGLFLVASIGLRVLLMLFSTKPFYVAACATLLLTYFLLSAGPLYELISRDWFERALRNAFGTHMPWMLIPWLAFASAGIGAAAVFRSILGMSGRWTSLGTLVASGLSLLGASFWLLRSSSNVSSFLADEGCRRQNASIECQSLELQAYSELATEAKGVWILLAISLGVAVMAGAALHQLNENRQRITQYVGLLWGVPAGLAVLLTLGNVSKSVRGGGSLAQMAQLRAEGEREGLCRSLGLLLQSSSYWDEDAKRELTEGLPSWRPLAASCVEQFAPVSQQGPPAWSEGWVCALSEAVNYRRGQVRCH